MELIITDDFIYIIIDASMTKKQIDHETFSCCHWKIVDSAPIKIWTRFSIMNQIFVASDRLMLREEREWLTSHPDQNRMSSDDYRYEIKHGMLESNSMRSDSPSMTRDDYVIEAILRLYKILIKHKKEWTNRNNCFEKHRGSVVSTKADYLGSNEALKPQES